jgi:hypothetical protein
VEPRGPLEGHDFKVGDAMGDGRLWSPTGLLVVDGRYRIFKDGSGWFACDVSNIVVGSLLELELMDGARVRVQVTRKAQRNLLFRPADHPPKEEAH